MILKTSLVISVDLFCVSSKVLTILNCDLLSELLSEFNEATKQCDVF